MLHNTPGTYFAEFWLPSLSTWFVLASAEKTPQIIKDPPPNGFVPEICSTSLKSIQKDWTQTGPSKLIFFANENTNLVHFSSTHSLYLSLLVFLQIMSCLLQVGNTQYFQTYLKFPNTHVCLFWRHNQQNTFLLMKPLLHAAATSVWQLGNAHAIFWPHTLQDFVDFFSTRYLPMNLYFCLFKARFAPLRVLSETLFSWF